MENAPTTITLDGTTYNVADFSEPVRQAIAIYMSFQSDLQKQQLEVLKTQAALQNIGAQIAAAAKKELEEKQAKSEDTAETAPAT